MEPFRHMWKSAGIKILTFGSFIAWIFTMLGFFGIDARTIAGIMTTHYILGIVSLICFIAFVFGCFLWWRSSIVTVTNIQAKVREWLDRFAVSHAVLPWPDWHFRIDATVNGQPLFIGRPRVFERYLFIQRRGEGIAPEHKAIHSSLTPEQRRNFYAEIAIETGRMKAFVTFPNSDLSDVILERRLLISRNLTEDRFVEAAYDVTQSAIMMWNAVGLRLSAISNQAIKPIKSAETSSSTPPLPPTLDKVASPPELTA